MTREDAIKILRANVMVACDTSDKVGYDTPLNKAIEQALEMAIKALEQDTVPREHYEHEYFLRKELDFKVARLEKQIAEQEPCEDCVSRKEVFETFGELLGVWGRRALMDLPSVTPTRNKGKWIRHEERKPLKYGYELIIKGKCSNCGEVFGETYKMNYCPNCGAEMESEE